MIRNYFKIAWRTMMRNKGYSFINIFGLTLGITCAALLVLYIQDELTFDKFHSKSDRTYRLVEIDASETPTRYYGITAGPVGPTLLDEFPQVVNYTRFLNFGGHINFLHEGERYAERDFAVVDSTFFEVFDFELVQGDRNTALSQIKSIVLTEAAAKKYFGDEDPIGKAMTEMNTQSEYKVTGVMKEFPTNSHLKFDMILTHFSNDERFQQLANDWGGYRAFTYVVLDDKNNLESFNENIPGFIERHWTPQQNRNFYLQSIEDIYFGSEGIEYGREVRSGQQFYIYIFSGVAFFVLLIAGINYMNLATAKSAQRAKEIGLRKASGAHRWQLISQFLGESMSITLIAFLLSIGLIDLLLPYFNELTAKEFSLTWETVGSILGTLFALSVFTGIVAGSYPAFVLSRFRPALVLKGESGMNAANPLLRKILVVGQFSLSIIMIVATFIVSDQLNYISSKEVGFDKERMVVVDINNGVVRRDFAAMKTEFSKVPGVQKVATSSRVPGEWKLLRQIDIKADELPADTLNSYFMGFDEDMIDTYGMKLTDGRNFEGIEANDSTKVLLNAMAVKNLGLTDPVGKTITIVGLDQPFTVIGVVDDFHFQSLYESVKPLVMGYWYHPAQSIDYFSIKVDGRNMEETLAGITKVHETFDEVTPIEYHFLESQWDLFYQKDQRAGTVFFIAAILTVLISCLGLFGLASFTMQKRMKEISLRKVMGASTQSLFMLLIRSFSLQVVMALVIASPVAYLLMSKWLENFAYKMSIGMLPFLIAGGLALLIAVITVSYSCLKTASSNPATTLKHE